MRRRTLIALVTGSVVARFPAAVHAKMQQATPSPLKSGQKVEGPIQVTDSLSIVYYYVGETLTTGATPPGTWLAAEVENTSDQPVVTPWDFRAQGFDENGNPYGDNAYLVSEPIVLAPGERTVIVGEIGSGLPPASFSSVGFMATEVAIAAVPLPITIEGIPARGKTRDVTNKQGAIRNTGDQVLDIDYLVTWFAPNGMTLGTCFGTNNGSVPPGKTLPIQQIKAYGLCGNVMTGAKILGVTMGDDTSYAIQVYTLS